MFSAKTLRVLIFLGFSLILGGLGRAASLPDGSSDENLPPLLEQVPVRGYEVLTPLGAGMKELPEAMQQLRREGAKAQAEAVVLLGCESGGMARDGLVFYKKDAYCRGLAIRYTNAPPVKSPRP